MEQVPKIGDRVRVHPRTDCKAPGSDAPHVDWHTPKADGMEGQIVRVDHDLHPTHPFVVAYGRTYQEAPGTVLRAGGWFSADEIEFMDV